VRLFIPPPNTKLRLTKPWFFDLQHREHNKWLFHALGLEYISYLRWRDMEYKRTSEPHRFSFPPPERVRLPKGTVLAIKRISEDSWNISFIVTKCPKFEVQPRFWASIDDCNRMHMVVVKEEESNK